jgi:dipeptidyl aminopeptidase/acylaminoacyl peptidase
MIRSCISLALTLTAAPLAAQQPTIEALMSAPFPTSLVAAPKGSAVAWVQNDQGVRNIWIATGPQYQARQLTKFSADDGQDLSALSWSPDQRTLVLVKGGAPNRQGEIPNPTSTPAGAEQAIWRVAVETGESTRIGPGSSPAISPRGDGLAFLRGGEVWWAPLSGGDAVTLVKGRGSEGSLSWSPDGTRLAFVSNRGDHSFVGVYHVADKTVVWVSPSVDSDRDPVWSPDGAQLAFIRTPTSSRLTIFRPTREASPWSIRIANPRTGESRQLWIADPGRGSAYWPVVAESQLAWLRDRIVFPWEKNGWVQLYSVPVAGGTAIHLTPGAFEVEYVTVHPNGSEVIYNSNQDDIDRRHLWRVAASGGAPQRLTPGNGIEWLPAVTSDGAIAFLASDARTPAHAAILQNHQRRQLAGNTIPRSFAQTPLVEPTAVMITAADGKQVPAQLFVPPNARAGDRRPAVVYLHGGSRRQMLLGFNYSSYYHNAYSLNQYLLSKGFVVLSLNYRSGIGYGMEFREALNYGATGGSEFYDVLGAGLYLRSRPEVDPARIGLWGGSYGGYLTAMGLSRASDLFAAGVDIHGVHDWNVGIRTFIPSYNVLERVEEARAAFSASPMATLDGWRSPVLVIHGDDDRNVSFAETVTLVEALRKRGVDVEQLVFPDEVHSFLRHANWLAAYRATADFLERKLGGGRTYSTGR